MGDRITKEQRSRNMSKVRSKNTSLEIKLRKKLSEDKYRYRLHYPIDGKPDIAFTKQKIAVFVHGCFWHQHGCSKSKLPTINKSFWEEKLSRNAIRDDLNYGKLTEKGWKIIIFWECRMRSEKSFAYDYKHLIELLI